MTAQKIIRKLRKTLTLDEIAVRACLSDKRMAELASGAKASWSELETLNQLLEGKSNG